MQFINAAMLLGLLAVAIPVIIQILNRKHTSKVMWGAMIFLLDSLRKRRKRVLLEEILLLACRCLLPALAALAAARPFIGPESGVPWVLVMPLLLLSITAFGVSFALWRYPRWRYGTLAAAALMFLLAAGSIAFERQLNLRRFGSGAAKDVVLIVDGSSSMSMARDGESNFERALKEAERFVDEAPKGTAFSLVIGGPVPQVLNPVPVADKRVLQDTMKRIRPTQGTMRIIPNLAAAAMTLASGNNGVKQIIIIGDGQTVGWDFGAIERWETVRRIFATLPSAPQIVWRTLSLPASIRNLTVSKVALSRDVVGTDRDVGVIVTVENTGTEAVTPKEVLVRIGEEALAPDRSIGQLEPGQSHSITFRHKFTRPGAALVQASVAADDDLPADDLYNFVAPVMDSLRVLIVDGNPASDILRRASTFVSLALRPDIEALAGGGAARDADFLVETEVRDYAAAVRMTDFSSYGVVALADVPRLPQETAEALARFTSMGGGLLMLPGARAAADAYNAWMFEGKPVLPARLSAFTNITDSADAARIAPDTFTHDALRNLRTGSDLGTVHPLQYWRLDTGLDGDAFTAGKLSDGSPFIVVKPFGRGAVAMSAFAFDAAASDIVARRGFVPLTHEIVYHLARPVGADLNVQPSDGATLILASQASAASVVKEGGGGLFASYYSAAGLNGEPHRRIDKSIDFDWGAGSPAPGVRNDYFSAVWNGTLIPKESGRYEFNVRADDSAVLTLDGRRVSGPLDLAAGSRHSIRLVFEEAWGTASCRLLWKRDGGAETAVPSDVLSPVGSGVGEGNGEMVSITDPYGEVFGGEIFGSDAGTALRISQSLVPGLYKADVPALFAAQIASAVGADGKIVFSVAAGKDESEMHAVTPEQTAFLGAYAPIATATQPEDVLKTLRGQSFGKEIWRIMAIAVFIFLIAEVVLTRWIAIQRRSGEEQDVDFSNDGQAGTASFKKSLAALGKGK